MDLFETLRTWLNNPLTTRLFVLVIGIILITILAGIVRRLATRYVADQSLRYKSRKMVNFFGYATALLFILLVFNEKLGGIAVALGVAGAGVAFALQEVITSVAGWMAVSFGGFYKVGDRVQLGGIKGDVIDIGILRTTIMQIGDWVDADQYNGRMVRVANSFVFKDPVINYSAEFPFLWDEIMIPIKYGSDHRMARDMIEQVAKQVIGTYTQSAEKAWKPITRRYLIEPASVQPMTMMTLNENWIEFTLRYVVDYKARRSIKDTLFSKILEEIDKSGDRIGIAAATLNIEKLAPLQVHLASETVPPAEKNT